MRLLFVLAMALAVTIAPIGIAYADDASGASSSVEPTDADALYASKVDNDWLKAAALYRKAADSGDAHAMVQLGSMYEDGKGLPSDIDEAVTLYRSAVEAGSSQGMYRLGLLFLSGHGVSKNAETARSYLTKAADGGVVPAMAALGKFYLDEKTYDDAVTWLGKAADAGDVNAMVGLAGLYSSGTGVTADAKRAVSYLRKAVDAGNSAAMVALGQMYLSGTGVPKDADTAQSLLQQAAASGDPGGLIAAADALVASGKGDAALPLYQKAADAGNGDALVRIGDLYSLGKNGVAQDYTKALDAYQKAASLNLPAGKRGVADIYLNGWGVPANVDKAIAMLTESGTQGDAPSYRLLGQHYDVVYDYPKALAAFEAGAALNDPISELEAGIAYHGGLGTPADDKRALDLFKQAAAQGNGDAMVRVGNYFATGAVVAKDASAADDWHNKGLATGDPAAMRDLAYFYENNNRTSDAVALYQKAIDAGDAQAPAMLGLIYYLGFGGVAEDDAKAVALYQTGIESWGRRRL